MPIKRLLSVLGDETLSAAKLMERLRLSHRPTFRKNYLNPALKQKLIDPSNPFCRFQSFHLSSVIRSFQPPR